MATDIIRSPLITKATENTRNGLNSSSAESSARKRPDHHPKPSIGISTDGKQCSDSRPQMERRVPDSRPMLNMVRATMEARLDCRWSPLDTRTAAPSKSGEITKTPESIDSRLEFQGVSTEKKPTFRTPVKEIRRNTLVSDIQGAFENRTSRGMIADRGNMKPTIQHENRLISQKSCRGSEPRGSTVDLLGRFIDPRTADYKARADEMYLPGELRSIDPRTHTDRTTLNRSSQRTSKGTLREASLYHRYTTDSSRPCKLLRGESVKTGAQSGSPLFLPLSTTTNLPNDSYDVGNHTADCTNNCML